MRAGVCLCECVLFAAKRESVRVIFDSQLLRIEAFSLLNWGSQTGECKLSPQVVLNVFYEVIVEMYVRMIAQLDHEHISLFQSICTVFQISKHLVLLAPIPPKIVFLPFYFKPYLMFYFVFGFFCNLIFILICEQASMHNLSERNVSGHCGTSYRM